MEQIDNRIIKLLETNQNILVIGNAGTGKTYLIKKIYDYLISIGKKVYKTATTGISALNLGEGGMTIHRWSGIQLGKESSYKILNRIKHINMYVKRYQCDTLIIDEVSMLGKKVFELINSISQGMRNEEGLPFGGIQIIVSGDFSQLKPVNDEYCFKSELWDICDFKLVELITPHRFSDSNYCSFLDRIRYNTPTKEDISFLEDKYNKYNENKSNEINGIKPTILFSKRVDVSDYNMSELVKICSEENKPVKFVCSDMITKKRKNVDDNKIKEYGQLIDENTPSSIILAVGAQCMLSYNVDTDRGLCNGSRCVITKLDKKNKKVYAFFLSTQKEEIIEYVNYEYETNDFYYSRSIIPLRLAWAISIHKSQSISLDYCIINLKEIFEYALIYVSLSRVRSGDGLLISNFSKNIFNKKINGEIIEFEKKIKDDVDKIVIS